MGTNCAPLVADLFLFCYERDFMKDLSNDNQADIIKAFNSTSRYLDDLRYIDNPYFEGMVNQIYSSLYFKRLCFLQIYDERDDFDFDIVNFPFFSWRCSTSSFLRGIYLSAYKICSSMKSC